MFGFRVFKRESFLSEGAVNSYNPCLLFQSVDKSYTYPDRRHVEFVCMLVPLMSGILIYW